MSNEDDLKHRSNVVAVREQVISLLKANNMTIDQVFSRGDLLQRKRKVKYRNPDNSRQVWCGRGRPPLWVRNLKDISCRDNASSEHEVLQQEIELLRSKVRIGEG